MVYLIYISFLIGVIVAAVIIVRIIALAFEWDDDDWDLWE